MQPVVKTPYRTNIQVWVGSIKSKKAMAATHLELRLLLIKYNELILLVIVYRLQIVML